MEIHDIVEKYKSVFAKDNYDVATIKDYEAHIAASISLIYKKEENKALSRLSRT